MSKCNDESISMLISMGFDLDQSQTALERHGGNVERAIDFLLSGNSADISQGGVDVGAVATASTSAPFSSAATSIVTSPTSQYSDPSGRSACTSIALTMAQHALKSLREASPPAAVGNVINSNFLETSITEGIRNYSILKTGEDSAEHSSVEEILARANNASDKNENNFRFSSLKLLENSPRQGILDSHPPSTESLNINPMGIYSLLHYCQNDASRSGSGCGNFVAVVITKPPETVLVLLPVFATNLSGSGCNIDSQSYILLDSHPRPNQHYPHNPQHGSYALLHSDLSGLVRSLQEIFPVTELGPDVPEMMGVMYNSFDVYPFVLVG